MTSLEAALAQAKMDATRGRLKGQEQAPAIGEPVDLESKLHKQIIEWCAAQWPRWQVRRNRMDKRSTAGVGDEDIIVFGPFPLCILVECKRAGKKLTKEQTIRAALMRHIGWDVPVARSMDEFLAAVDGQKAALERWKNG